VTGFADRPEEATEPRPKQRNRGRDPPHRASQRATCAHVASSASRKTKRWMSSDSAALRVAAVHALVLFACGGDGAPTCAPRGCGAARWRRPRGAGSQFSDSSARVVTAYMSLGVWLPECGVVTITFEGRRQLIHRRHGRKNLLNCLRARATSASMLCQISYLYLFHYLA
jgi:hypothetical protein